MVTDVPSIIPPGAVIALPAQGEVEKCIEKYTLRSQPTEAVPPALHGSQEGVLQSRSACTGPQR